MVDLPLRVSQVTLQNLDIIQKMAPFGMGNPKPIFVFPDLKILDIRKLGSESRHLKLITKESEIVAWGW